MSRGKSISSETEQRVLGLHQLGMNNVKIAKEIGISESSVSRVIRRTISPSAEQPVSALPVVPSNLSKGQKAARTRKLNKMLKSTKTIRFGELELVLPNTVRKVVLTPEGHVFVNL